MTIRSRRRSFAPSSIGRSFPSGSAHSNTRAPSATTSWLGTMTPTTTAASAISRRPTCITAARRRSSTCVTAPAAWPTPRIRSDSSADHHAQKPCRPPYGSIRRPKRPARMPQDRRPATPGDSQHAVVARPRPPHDRSSLHRVDGRGVATVNAEPGCLKDVDTARLPSLRCKS